jgi:hypothetical protein
MVWAFVTSRNPSRYFDTAASALIASDIICTIRRSLRALHVFVDLSGERRQHTSGDVLSDRRDAERTTLRRQQHTQRMVSS